MLSRHLQVSYSFKQVLKNCFLKTLPPLCTCKTENRHKTKEVRLPKILSFSIASFLSSDTDRIFQVMNVLLMSPPLLCAQYSYGNLPPQACLGPAYAAWIITNGAPCEYVALSKMLTIASRLSPPGLSTPWMT